ncbi:hypothetical protein E4T38_01540 [Aureobasidium subglaciale]|nr:hypothetical protein E4T38_01540 [Aureobasidium subglaciale]KAI5219065.1 hypothetical protein E4T40_06608 [Aureobasidium subglaciale]KAI5233195.1 hypothetical protein E4T41_01538 [Aureobasidium subglaciale]KAI5260084.1 hypothetical protein E4T46_06408 [Aureobasidium subglaciale]
MSASKQHPPLHFSIAVADQATQITTLVNTAFRSEPTGQTWLYDDQSKRIDILPPGVAATLITSTDSLMLVGTLPGNTTPITTCFLRKPSTPPQAHMSESAAWFGLLAVQPEYHGRSYGIATLREAERYVRDEWGIGRLEMDYNWLNGIIDVATSQQARLETFRMATAEEKFLQMGWR